jgi:photosystem II stability/assembly factor-like uncharacterized protein
MRSWRVAVTIMLVSVGTLSRAQTTDPRSHVQQLVDAVSRDSLMSFVISLENCGTRYEFSSQRDSAASYIMREFSRWGLETTSDDYLFSNVAFRGGEVVSDSCVFLVGSLILRSTNGGVSWMRCTLPSNGYFTGIDFVDAIHGWIVSNQGVIAVTNDGGSHWTTQTDVTSEFPSFQAVSFGDALRGIAAGWKHTYRTSNGGIRWMPCDMGIDKLFDVHMTDSVNAWAVGSQINGIAASIIASTDGGSTWNLQFVSDSCQLRAIHMVSSSLGWAVGSAWSSGRRALILKTTDGGAHWVTQAAPSGLMSLHDVKFQDSLRGWTIDMSGRLLRTDNGGRTWDDSAIGWTSSPCWLALGDRGDVYVCGWGIMNAGCLIQKSTNAGQTWLALTEHLPPEIVHRSRNIVATLPGKSNPGKECLVLAHYDSEEQSPGANDDASGVSAVMEAARLASRYEFASTIRFLTVSAEELWMLGSGSYAQEAKRQSRAIIGVMNADMIGYPIRGDTSELVIASAWDRIPLLDSAVAFNRLYNIGLRLRDTTDDSGACDYIPFALAGYPALNMTEGTAWEIWGGGDPYYHTPLDTYDKVHYGLVRRGAQIMLATIAELARPLGKTTSVAAAGRMPSGFHMEQNFPNPFNPSTTIRYALSKRSPVMLTLFNTLGQQISVLQDGEQEAGYHDVKFDGNGMSSGVYFYRLLAGDFIQIRRLLLLK